DVAPYTWSDRLHEFYWIKKMGFGERLRRFGGSAC
ncbi:MAG: hypothetical protein ACD_46C00414G0001, partial [uncultured bacterium]